eukprot:6481978-Amphidinium_carterae.2
MEVRQQRVPEALHCNSVFTDHPFFKRKRAALALEADAHHQRPHAERDAGQHETQHWRRPCDDRKVRGQAQDTPAFLRAECTVVIPEHLWRGWAT